MYIVSRENVISVIGEENYNLLESAFPQQYIYLRKNIPTDGDAVYKMFNETCGDWNKMQAEFGISKKQLGRIVNRKRLQAMRK